MVSLKERKDALFKITHPYFSKIGFRFDKGIPNKYYRNEKELIYDLGFNFLIKSDFHTNSLLMISFKKVEEIVIEIGMPNNDLIPYKNGENYMITIKHPFYYQIYEQKFSQIDLKTVEGFEQWGHLILEYMEGEGKAFMEHYSYLPNVLKEMDRLEAEGKYWNEILVGLADYDFRGLIISKLCNDPNFNEKIKSRDEVFYNVPQLKEWVPYYEKLKERLKTIEPLHNNP